MTTTTRRRVSCFLDPEYVRFADAERLSVLADARARAAPLAAVHRQVW